MPNVISCPSDQDLQQLLLGQISDADAEPLEEHLERCDRCLQTAGTLKAEDTLAEAVRTQSAVAEMSSGEMVEGLMQRLEKLRPAMAPVAQASAGTIPVDAAPPATPPLAATQVMYDFLAPAQAPEELGRLGPYRILRVLGAGGMGVVFQAEDPHLGRLVALKAMLPALASNPAARQRFLREAKAVAAIEHDHIVTIHQVGEDRGVPFLAMPLLKGESLEDRLKREAKLPVSQVLQIGREIAEGLAAAHALGLIHRDIKPANLWLEGKEGGSMKEATTQASDNSFKRVKILDFGLARAVGDATQLTQSGAIMGSPAYMAPEQTRAGSVVDQRADLFSLGCVLYRMLTGELPFKGSDTMSLLAALALDTPPAPRELDPRIPVALSDLVMELLAKKPADRPASARDVVARIGAMEQALGVVDQAPGLQKARKTAAAWLPPSSRPRGRRWLPVAVAVFLGALALGAFQFGPAVYRFVTNQGQLVIETNEPDVEVIVKQGGEQITILDKKTSQEVTLMAGTYQLELPRQNKDGLWKLSTSQFTLERGGRVIVKVTLGPRPPEGRDKLPAPNAKEQVLRKFGRADKPLTQVTQEGDELALDWVGRIDAQGPRTVRLFEIPNPGVDDCMVIYRASMKSADLKGRAYLEMWCRFPGQGEAFSKGFENAVDGTTDWASCQAPFFLKKGERPDLIKLNVVIEGKGTVWIKDVKVLQAPLSGAKPGATKQQQQSRAASLPVGEVRVFKGHSGEVTSVKLKDYEDFPARLEAYGENQKLIGVRFDVDEKTFLRLKKMKEGQLQQVELRVSIPAADEEEFSHKAALRFIADKVNATTGTVDFHGAIANPPQWFLPGMFARVRITFVAPKQ